MIYQLSPYLRIISKDGLEMSMAYHSLFGNPRIINNEGMKFLQLFRQPISIEDVAKICEDDPSDIIRGFKKIFFLVEPLFDEKEYLYRKKLLHLSRVKEGYTVDRMGLAISDFCNLGCDHCIHSQAMCGKPVFEKSIKQFNMSWETARACIDRYVALMREKRRTHCKIHFGNAEPLINWPVINKVLHYCEQMQDLTFEFAINTNLMLMTREMAEMMKKYQVRIATSLDGTRGANDAIRVTKSGMGTFDRILQKFDLMEEIGYPLDGFSITVTNKNFGLIDTDIIDLAAERKMKSVAFDYDLISLVNVSIETRVARLMLLKEHANKLGIDFFGTWDSAFRNLTSESLLAGNHAFCAAVEGKSLEFNVDGSIKICSHSSTSVGQIENFNQIFLESGGLFKIVEERFPGTDAYCQGCDIEGLCGGQCHVTREVAARSTEEARQKFFSDMCDFYRAVTKALAVEYLQSNGSIELGKNQNCFF